MKEMTGADEAVEAWRSFFEPGDVVGIKMKPVGNPLADSSRELMLEVIEGLKSADVKLNDMFVFERYREEFFGNTSPWRPTSAWASSSSTRPPADARDQAS